jgi:hypothetical protein
VRITGFFALNNNFHPVRRMYPEISWNAFPALYTEQKEKFMLCN